MITESQLKVADLSVDLVSRKVSRAGNRIVLTSKEFSLLEFFIRHQGEVLPRSLIASQVWDMNFDSDTNAIDVAVKRLRAKNRQRLRDKTDPDSAGRGLHAGDPGCIANRPDDLSHSLCG